MSAPSLYGIVNTNRSATRHWTKNCFNSSFPVSLACWMRDHDKDAVYVSADKNGELSTSKISISDVFGSSLTNEDLRFDFESRFPQYDQYAYNAVTGIDVVVGDGENLIRPLEIKLTVVPDSTTHKLSEDKWGAELVIRPASTQFCALGMSERAIEQDPKRFREIFDSTCASIQHWDNATEIRKRMSDLLICLDQFQEDFFNTQQPFLMQPVWKTEGMQPGIAPNAFDLIVWSDHALTRAFIDRSRADKGDGLTRKMRASVRLARTLWEISRGSRVDLPKIYTEMAFGLQTDKEMSFSGKEIRALLDCAELSFPRISREVLADLILGGGQKLLSPERRFDASVYFTAEYLFGSE